MLQVDLDNILPEEDALQRITDIFQHVEEKKEVYVITKGGRPVLAIVDIEHLEKDMDGMTVQNSSSEPEAPIAPAEPPAPAPYTPIPVPVAEPLASIPETPGIEPIAAVPTMSSGDSLPSMPDMPAIPGVPTGFPSFESVSAPATPPMPPTPVMPATPTEPQGIPNPSALLDDPLDSTGGSPLS